MTAIPNPIPYFTDLDGDPLDGGYIYVGIAGMDARTNPVATFWDNDLTIPAAQPIRTVNGYPLFQGRPAPFFITDDEASITILQSNGVAVITNSEFTSTAVDIFAILAATGGAALIGAATGGTVEDAIFHKGRATPIAGSKMAIEWLRDDPASPLEDQAGIWSGPVQTSHGFNKVFDVADGGVNAPSQTLFVRAENAGSLGDIVAITQIAVATVDDTVVFGSNIIAGSTGNDNVKLVGLEIDVEPSLTDTNLRSGAGGLFINMFNLALPGPAIQTGSVGGGTFNNGVILGGLVSTAAGLALEGSSQANSLINTTVGTFTGTALTLGTGSSRGILFSEDGARIFYDGTNIREVLPTGGSWVFRDSTDATSIAALDNSGNFNVSGAYQVDGVQVVSNRDTGWATQTAAASKANLGSSPTVGQLASWASAVDAALKAHGLFGT